MDNDQYGHVNNVVYYSYFDTAVNGYLIEASGCDIRQLPAIGIVADLVESVIKRRANMKDSGRSIPGIGGMFDLSDSLLLAAPVGYFFFGLP